MAAAGLQQFPAPPAAQHPGGEEAALCPVRQLLAAAPLPPALAELERRVRPGPGALGLAVIVLDPDPATRTATAVDLRALAFRPVPCARVAEAEGALAGLAQGTREPAVLLAAAAGLEGCPALVQQALGQDVPTVVVTADESFDAALAAVRLGAADCLSRPLRKKELRNLWQHVWRRKVRALEEEGGAEGKGKARKKPTKPRADWTPELHQRFVAAVNELGFDNAVPKKVLQLMNTPHLTREQVASHMQKYRIYLKRLETEKAATGSPPHPPAAGDGRLPPVSKKWEGAKQRMMRGPSTADGVSTRPKWAPDAAPPASSDPLSVGAAGGGGAPPPLNLVDPATAAAAAATAVQLELLQEQLLAQQTALAASLPASLPVPAASLPFPVALAPAAVAPPLVNLNPAAPPSSQAIITNALLQLLQQQEQLLAEGAEAAEGAEGNQGD